MVSLRIVRKRHKKLPGAVSGATRVKVGFVASQSKSSSIERAIWNEFGTKGGASGGGWGGPIPERPFMRNAMRDNRGKYRDAMAASAGKILRGDTQIETTLRKLGSDAQDDIKVEISSLSSPPNSPVTIALKGSDKPLINTGEMASNVRWKIDK